MGDFDNYVEVLITLQTLGLGRLEFGVPLYLSGIATFPERVRAYTSVSQGITDGFIAGTAEHRLLSAVFAQSTHPPRVLIGRAVNRPTMVYTLTPVVIDSHVYTIRVRGPGFDSTLTFTSGVGTTATLIVTGFITALNGVTGKNYTASGTTTLVVTGNTAGAWFSVEILNRSEMALALTHADPGVTTDLDAIALENSDFYTVLTGYNSEDYAIAVADWVQSNGRHYMLDVVDSAAATAAVGGGDLMDTIATEAYSRVSANFHPQPAEMFSAAWAARVLPLPAGTETWFGKTLAGVAPVKLTPTERLNIVAKNGNSYERARNRNVTFNGMTGDGDFIDIIRSIDWITDEMAASVAEILFDAPTKVPFSDKGISRVEGGMWSVLARAVGREMLDETIDPISPTVTVPKALDISLANRALRHLPDMLFNGRLTGAIHKVFIRGTLSV